MDEHLLVCHSCRTFLILALIGSVKGVLPAETSGELLKAKLCAFLTLHDGCELRFEKYSSGYDGLPTALNNYREFTESEGYKQLATREPEGWFVRIIEDSKRRNS